MTAGKWIAALSTFNNMTLEEIIKERILILDGAMGTMIQHYGLTEDDFRGKLFADIDWQMKGNNDILTLTRPDVIEDIHRKYLEAGADLIETCTFSAQRISMSEYHVENLCREINIAAAQIARKVAEEYSKKTPEKPRFVIGSLGPTNKTCSISPEVENPAFRAVTFDEMKEAYEEQIEALMDGGVDALLNETIFDTLNSKAFLVAAEEVFNRKNRRLPLMLSVTVSDKAGRTLSGQTLKAFLTSVEHAPLFSVGLNCSFGPLEIKPYLEELANNAPFYISVYPNAGLPNGMGDYDITPQQMAQQMRCFTDEKLVNIIGGCCGTTDAFIAEYPSLVKGESGWKQPHLPKRKTSCLTLSGLDTLEVKDDNNFINVGERCNVAGSRKFLRLINEKNYEEAQQIARCQVEDGAQILDINMDDALLDTKTEMVHFLNLIQSDPDIARVPIMIDSSKWDVIIAALKCVQGKCVVNSISLKEGEDVFIQHARDLRKFGAAVVVMAFDEEGQATSYERKIAICERAYRLLTEKVGFNPYDIIFDPNILTIGTGIEEHNNYAVNFINATSWIRRNLPGAHVSGGVSNLSFAFRGNNYIRHAMHAIFLYHAIQAGMDMGIVNPSVSLMYEDIPEEHRRLLEELIFNRCSDAAERVMSFMSEDIVDENKKHKEKETVQNVEDRLKVALRRGIIDNLSEDLQEALVKYKHAGAIIEGPLMDGMDEVGRLFGDGKMFLPQVVKTARTMKKAVEILQPYLEKDKQNEGTSSRGRVLLATVKGDVHDIGKNIVSVVMGCNNYEIIDLGVMVPAEKIVDAALKYKVDAIGLSGLITPSLDEMVHTAQQLHNAGIHVPLMIGGAATSEKYTQMKVVPVYGNNAVWVKDAAQNVLICGKLLSSYIPHYEAESTNEHQQTATCDCPQCQTQKIISLEKSRENKPKLF